MSIEDEEFDSDGWWEEFDQLSPQEQDAILYDVGYERATETPWTFGESTAPELGYNAYDLLTMGGGVDIPEYTSKGELDPFDLTQQGKRQTVAKGYGSAMLDNILTGMAGPGAYDIGAFTPTYEYGEPLNMKGKRKAEVLANQGGYMGFIADQMLNEDKSYAEAEAAMWAAVETPDDDPELTDQDRALKESILATLPSAKQTGQPTPPSGGMSGRTPEGRDVRSMYDQERVSAQAEGLWNELMEDPEYGYEEGGRFYEREPEMIKTPQMEFFDQYGLAYPTASYEDPQYLQAALDAQGTTPESRAGQTAAFEAEMAGLNRQVGAASAEYTGANKANQALQEAWANAPERRMTDQDARREGGWDAMAQFREQYGVPVNGPVGPGGPQLTGGSAAQGPPITGQQAGAQFSNLQRSLGGGMGGSAPMTVDEAAEMLRQGFADRGGPSTAPAAATPPMIKTGPFVTTSQAGDITPWDFGNPRGERSWADLALGMNEPTRRRATQKDVETQGRRRQEAAGKVQRESHARNQMTYRDPELAAMTAQAKLWALAEQGRSPFGDQSALRQQALRALGL